MNRDRVTVTPARPVHRRLAVLMQFFLLFTSALIAPDFHAWPQAAHAHSSNRIHGFPVRGKLLLPSRFIAGAASRESAMGHALGRQDEPGAPCHSRASLSPDRRGENEVRGVEHANRDHGCSRVDCARSTSRGHARARAGDRNSSLPADHQSRAAWAFVPSPDLQALA